MIVVDAAAVVDVLSGASGTDELRDRLATEDLHAPMLLDFEVVSALRGMHLRGQLSAARADDLLDDFDDLLVQRRSSAPALRRRTFELRHTVSAYDAAYVTLAEALDCALVTRDRRLARSSRHEARIEVR